jgi:hypothetical protein
MKYSGGCAPAGIAKTALICTAAGPQVLLYFPSVPPLTQAALMKTFYDTGTLHLQLDAKSAILERTFYHEKD